MKNVNNFLLLLLYLLLLLMIQECTGMAINLLEAGQLQFHEPNYCNDSSILEEAGLQRSPLGQFIGYSCSAEFYHCRWQSNGFLTYKKTCKMGLVYDTMGTQNCNFDFNIKGCGMRSDGGENCQKNEFSCPLSESCVPLFQRCDGNYDCLLEEDEQNCPMCAAGEFACIVSEQCISSGARCNGVVECDDGTDESNCEGCGQGFFHCLKSSECVPISQRCDGTPQCTHGEDELLCKKTHERFYVCENRLDQVPIAQVCDGTENCPDASDEKYCTQSPMQPPQPGPPPPQSASFPMANANEIADYDRFQQQRYVQEQQENPEAEEAQEEEEEEENGDDEHPVSPLMPIAQFFPTSTTTKKPTTKLYTAAIRVEPVKLPKKLTVNPKLEIKPRPITSSISEVAVTAAAPIFVTTPRKLPPPPIPYVRPASTNREKVVASITITTTPPQVPTFPTTATLEESMDKIEEELIAKLGARLNNQNKFSARDILSKLETLLASSDPSGAASALVSASASAPSSIISIPSLPKQPPPSGAGSLSSSSSAYNSQQQHQINSNINSNSNNNNNINAYPPIRFDPHPKTSVLDTRRFGGFGSQKLRSRVRVTGRPSSRKWRPSLSNNPSHRTTPLPQSEAEIAVQFRQSDASKTTVSPALVPAAEIESASSKSTEMPTKMAHPILHKRVSTKGTLISNRSAAVAAVPSSPTQAKDALEPDETYFTYDERP